MAFDSLIYSQWIYSSYHVTYAFFIAAYAVLGGGIKYIDDAFDEKTFSKIKAVLLAPFLGGLWAFTMTLHPASATILAAIVLAVLLRGKIDNLAFMVGTVTIITALFFSGLATFLWLPLILITLAGVLDEVGNDYVDKNFKANKFIYIFFEYRFTMKLAVLYFAAINYFVWVYFFAFIAFDVAYALVMHYSMNLAHKRKFYYHKRANHFW